ncbi:MAG: hypothetical protein Kow00122_10760 [Thermoleophilia bacterium]
MSPRFRAVSRRPIQRRTLSSVQHESGQAVVTYRLVNDKENLGTGARADGGVTSR